jgi:hypothetical protein
MVYNAVPPPQGLYSANTPSGTPRRGGPKAPAGGQFTVKRNGNFQGSGGMQQDVDWDGQKQEFVGKVPYAHGRYMFLLMLSSSVPQWKCKNNQLYLFQ